MLLSFDCLTVSSYSYYCPAPNVNGGSIESASMGLPRYHETASNRNGLRFPHPPPVNHQHHNYHHPALPMQGVRGHGVNFHPPVTAASFRVPTNPSHGAAMPTPNGFEMGPRHVGPVPSGGLRIYRPHRGVMHDTIGHRNIPPMGFLHVDDVALIDEVGNLVDHHRDMRMDIEDMSYEANEAALDDREADSCIICQDEYKNKEKIGVLRCEHEYHADCLRKWLIVKNVCPICKSEALTPGGKDV
ncbi:hypothetical protein Ahy_A07g037303 isoform B [Arachis hypogaea]|uniref:RING-type E3 ubiquitin transferase n=1 Tax=Arachis hypogaea TaxID=3818 RepID=A0A445CIE1_ARAHY|nr:hypothetical protein Ahy_A07g037303 isoform B [Arachis hypogaea]